MALNNEIGNTFQFLISELWNTLVLSSIGENDMVEERLIKVITFLKEKGITEEVMALEAPISKESIVNLISTFKDR